MQNLCKQLMSTFLIFMINAFVNLPGFLYDDKQPGNLRKQIARLFLQLY